MATSKRRTEIQLKIDNDITYYKKRLCYAEKNRRKVHDLSALVSELLKENLKSPYLPGDARALTEYRDWLSRVEKLGPNNFAITEKVKEAHILMDDPYPRMANAKQGLQVVFKENQESLQRLNRLCERLEKRIHKLQVEKYSLGFSKAGVEYTKLNILLTILVPVAIFLATLLFESWKPELPNWIRQHILKIGTLQSFVRGQLNSPGMG